MSQAEQMQGKSYSGAVKSGQGQKEQAQSQGRDYTEPQHPPIVTGTTTEFGTLEATPIDAPVGKDYAKEYNKNDPDIEKEKGIFLAGQSQGQGQRDQGQKGQAQKGPGQRKTPEDYTEPLHKPVVVGTTTEFGTLESTPIDAPVGKEYATEYNKGDPDVEKEKGIFLSSGAAGGQK